MKSLCARHNTVYDDCQGLHDNGSGCIALVKLAEIFKNIDTKHTIRFVATGSEEFNLTGAREYVRMREQNGSISRIKGCINIDFVTQFPNKIGVICTNEFDNAPNNVLQDWEMRLLQMHGHSKKKAFLLSLPISALHIGCTYLVL